MNESWERWEARYAAGRAWSGAVNAVIAAWDEDRDQRGAAPGTAIELACGEGADALWLAARGWSVTAVDFSPSAIARAREHAAEAGVSVSFEVADLAQWAPVEPADLVTACFVHEAPEVRATIWDAAARCVAPGGTLLVVGHSLDETEETPGPPPASRFTAAEVIAAVGEGWTAQVSSPERPGLDGTTRVDLVVELLRTA